MNKCNALVQGISIHVKVPGEIPAGDPGQHYTNMTPGIFSDISFTLPLPQHHYGCGYHPEIMITYWCSKKNSIHNWIDHGIDFVPFSVPCIRSECEYWREGECIHLTIKGK
jgi:hypothetical protein